MYSWKASPVESGSSGQGALDSPSVEVPVTPILAEHDVKKPGAIASRSSGLAASQPAPALAAAMTVFERLSGEVSASGTPPAESTPPSTPAAPTTALPMLSADAKPNEQLAEALRWFDGLPRSAPPSAVELDAKRAQMSKAGLDLLASDCRSGVCRLSFVYSKSSSEQLVKRMGGHDSARKRTNWWSFSTINSDGRVEGHVFMLDGGSAGRSG
jgi:hypothetical protein